MGVSVQSVISGTPQPRFNTGNTIISLGDSLSENGFTLTTVNPGFSDYGWQTWANMFIGGRLNWIRNAGVIGERSDQILARVGSDVIPYSPTFCTVLAGRNDNNQGVAVSVVKQNLQAIYTQLLSAGIQVIAVTLQPVYTGAAISPPSTANSAWENELNVWIREYATNTPGMILADFAQVFIDPLQSPNIAKVGYCKTDNVHFSPKGARAVGAYFASLISPLVPPRNYLPITITDTYGTSPTANILDNGFFTGTGGTVAGGASGTVASNWTVSIDAGTPTAAASVASRSDGFGSDQVVTITSASASDQVAVKNTASFASRLSTGATYIAQCKMSCTGNTNLTGIKAWMQITVGGTAYAVHMLNTSLLTYDNSDLTDIVLTSTPFTIPAGAITSSFFVVRTYFGGVGGAVLKVGQAAIRPL